MRKKGGILDCLVDVLNESEDEAGTGGKWKRMHSTPQQIIDVPGVGRIHRDVNLTSKEKEKEDD